MTKNEKTITANKIIELEIKYKDFLDRLNKFNNLTKNKSFPISTLNVLINEIKSIIKEIDIEKRKLEGLIEKRKNNNEDYANLELSLTRIELLSKDFRAIRNKFFKIKKAYNKLKGSKNNNKIGSKKYKSTKEVEKEYNLIKEVKNKTDNYKKLQKELNLVLDLVDEKESKYKENLVLLDDFLEKNNKKLSNYKDYLQELNNKMKQFGFKTDFNFKFENKLFSLNDNINDKFYKELEYKETILHKFLDYLDLYEDCLDDFNILKKIKKEFNLKESVLIKKYIKILDIKEINEYNYQELISEIQHFYKEQDIRKVINKIMDILSIISLIENDKNIIKNNIGSLTQEFNISNKEEEFLKKYFHSETIKLKKLIKKFKGKYIMDVVLTKINGVDIVRFLEELKEKNSQKANKISKLFTSFDKLISFMSIFEYFNDYIDSKIIKINDYKLISLIREVQKDLYDDYVEYYENAFSLFEDFKETDYTNIEDYEKILKYSEEIELILKNLNYEISLLNKDIEEINNRIKKINNYNYNGDFTKTEFINSITKNLILLTLKEFKVLIIDRLKELAETRYNSSKNRYYNELERKARLRRSSYTTSSYSNGYSSSSSYSSGSSSFGSGTYGGSSSF